MITEQHTMEALSRACIQAIAGKAGFNLSVREFDYGIDGSFNEITILNRRRVESGFCIHFQLKASTKWVLTEHTIFYDLEAKTYNDIVGRVKGTIPCLLILLTLPRDRTKWLEHTEVSLTIGGNCYYKYLSGIPTLNKESVRISIDRRHKLTSADLNDLFQKVKSGQQI
jgi:hypothetical protein